MLLLDRHTRFPEAQVFFRPYYYIIAFANTKPDPTHKHTHTQAGSTGDLYQSRYQLTLVPKLVK